jgi:hypothetical protein
MRKRRSPKGADLPSRLWALWRVRSVLAGGVLAASTLCLRAQTDKGLTTDRADRVEQAQVQQADTVKADTEVWVPAKIILNLDARCPVVLALGYFGAFDANDPDPAKAAVLQARFAQLQKAAQPIAVELKQMALSTSFVGQKFPSALNPRLEALSGELYGTVLKLYGDDGLAELKEYVALSTEGAVVDRVK